MNFSRPSILCGVRGGTPTRRTSSSATTAEAAAYRRLRKQRQIAKGCLALHAAWGAITAAAQLWADSARVSRRLTGFANRTRVVMGNPKRAQDKPKTGSKQPQGAQAPDSSKQLLPWTHENPRPLRGLQGPYKALTGLIQPSWPFRCLPRPPWAFLAFLFCF